MFGRRTSDTVTRALLQEGGCNLVVVLPARRDREGEREQQVTADERELAPTN
jgi:hypothetical protein